MTSPLRIGILPALGNGLAHWQASGQLTRYLTHWRAYRTAADSLLVASYLDPCTDALAVRRFRAEVGSAEFVYPGAALMPRLLRALTWPLRQPQPFRRCTVLRATSLLGVLPALTARVVWGTPFVVSVGADYAAIARLHGRQGQVRKYDWLWRLTLRAAAVIFVPSLALAGRLQRVGSGFPIASEQLRGWARKIEYHPNWVDTARFCPPPAPWPIHRGRTVLYVGRLVREKNLERLARACRAARASLLCVGDGPLRPRLTQLGASCVGVQPWEVLPSWHTLADAFALVSHSEGGPKSLLEAMSSALPCLVSDAVDRAFGWPGALEGYAEVRRADDADDLAAGVETVLRPEAAALGQAARQYVVRECAMERVLANEVGTLRRVAR